MLAGRLGRHPGIVTPAIKEPNYFSSRLQRGHDWYAGLFPRTDGQWLDASAQYTFPSHLDAIDRAIALAPQLRVVYLVRDPIPRAYSHYCHEVLYLGKHHAASFGSALSLSADLAGASDYALILERLRHAVPERQLLVLPFEYVIGDLAGAAELTWRFAGLDPACAAGADSRPADELFANERAVIQNPVVRRAFNTLRGTRLYPKLRAAIGPQRMRAARARLTTSDSIPSLQQAMASCSPADVQMLEDLSARAALAVREHLAGQDRRMGTELAAWCRWAEASR